MYRISQLNVILANKKISQRKTRFYNEILLYTLFRGILIIYNDQWWGGGISIVFQRKRSYVHSLKLVRSNQATPLK